MTEINSHSIRVSYYMPEGNPVLNIQIWGNGASTARLYIFVELNVPSFSSRYFNKIKRTSR